MTAAEQALYESLTDEDIERAREECEIEGGFATWRGMTSRGWVAITWRAVGFWEPQGRGWSDRRMYEVEEEPEFVEAMQ